MSVYCEGCGTEFPEYKEVGQAIKDQVRAVSLAESGGIIINSTALVPIYGTVKIDAEYKIVMNRNQAWEAHIGSRRDALNVAKFPCPTCQEFVKWRRTAIPKYKKSL